MKSIKSTVFAALCVLLLASCSTMELTTSYPEPMDHSREHYLYDSESQILYMVSNDRDSLHLKLKTNNRTTIAKFLRQEPRIYFDLNGKKKQKVYVQYPLPDQNPTSVRPQASGGAGNRQHMDPGMMWQQMSKDILFVNHDEEELLQPSALVPVDIRCELFFEGNGELVYELAIPFYRISEGGLASIEKLSLGIETESPDRSGAPGADSGGRSGGMGGRSGGMGGGPGGMGGMGGGSGGMGGRSGGMGGRSGGMSRESMMTPVEIWFGVDLHRD